MLSRVVIVLVMATATVAGQGRGGGGDQGGTDVQMSARALTPFEQFAGKLKIDVKTQGAAVEQIFAEGAKEAGPIATQLLQSRQRLVNAELAGKPEDVKPALEAYTAAAAKMTGLEASVFAKVVASLTPAQQSRGVEGFEQAFAIMAGFFQQAAPRVGGRGGGGRGGEDRGGGQ